jgi:hypothetical protein
MTPVAVKVVAAKAGTDPAKVRSARRAKRFIFIEDTSFGYVIQKDPTSTSDSSI